MTATNDLDGGAGALTDFLSAVVLGFAWSLSLHLVTVIVDWISEKGLSVRSSGKAHAEILSEAPSVTTVRPSAIAVFGIKAAGNGGHDYADLTDREAATAWGRGRPCVDHWHDAHRRDHGRFWLRDERVRDDPFEVVARSMEQI